MNAQALSTSVLLVVSCRRSSSLLLIAIVQDSRFSCAFRSRGSINSTRASLSTSQPEIPGSAFIETAGNTKRTCIARAVHMRVGQRDHLHSCREGRFHAVGRVFENEAIRRIGAQVASGDEEDVGCGLAAQDARI